MNTAVECTSMHPRGADARGCEGGIGGISKIDSSRPTWRALGSAMGWRGNRVMERTSTAMAASDVHLCHHYYTRRRPYPVPRFCRRGRGYPPYPLLLDSGARNWGADLCSLSVRNVMW